MVLRLSSHPARPGRSLVAKLLSSKKYLQQQQMNLSASVSCLQVWKQGEQPSSAIFERE